MPRKSPKSQTVNPSQATEAGSVAAKKAPAKKAAAKKVAKKVAKKAAQRLTGARLVKEASATAATAAVKTRKAKSTKKAKPTGHLYFDKSTYKEFIAGLMDQGLDHADAVETLKVGLRQANGIPVPAMLLNSSFDAHAASAA
jgi:hypothetical protein